MENMAEQISEMDNVLSNLAEIHSDTTVPRNIRAKIEAILINLRNEAELPIKVNKALNELDEIVNDVNMQSYTRTQIWNAMSTLEKL